MQLADAPLIALASARAGLGKSTLACALGLSLRARDIAVGWIDADPDCPDLSGLLAPHAELPLFSLAHWRTDAGLERVRGELWEQRLAERIAAGFDWPSLDLVLLDLAPGAIDPREAELFGIDACIELRHGWQPPLPQPVPLLLSIPRVAAHPAWREAGRHLASLYPSWPAGKPPREAVERVADELLERLESPDWRSAD
ncbi:MAG: P-loop NTPase [Planctomycetia bacterium]